MPYTKTVWVDGTTEITAARLNNLEEQHGEAVVDARVENEPLRAEVVASLPAAGTAGRLVFNTDDDKFYFDTGTAWRMVVERVPDRLIYDEGSSDFFAGFEHFYSLINYDGSTDWSGSYIEVTDTRSDGGWSSTAAVIMWPGVILGSTGSFSGNGQFDANVLNVVGLEVDWEGDDNNNSDAHCDVWFGGYRIRRRQTGAWSRTVEQTTTKTNTTSPGGILVCRGYYASLGTAFCRVHRIRLLYLVP